MPLKRSGLDKQNGGKKAKTKTEHVVLKDPKGVLGSYVDQILQQQKIIDDATSLLTNAKDSLKEDAFPAFIDMMRNAFTPESSVLALNSNKTAGAMVGFTRKYPEMDDASMEAVEKIIGEKTLQEYFYENNSASINLDFVPADMQAEAVQDLKDLMRKYGANVDAEGNVSEEQITITSTVRPNARFHSERHRVLTPAQNISVQEVYPMTVSVKTKNVKI